jgi:hypothetical protein
MGKIEIEVKPLCDLLVSGKFGAVIGRKTVNAVRKWAKQVYDHVSDRLRASTRNLTQERHAGLTFGQGHQRFLSARAQQCVHFPITDTQTVVDHGGTLLDADSVRYFAATIVASIPFAALLMTPEVPIEVSAITFVF